MTILGATRTMREYVSYAVVVATILSVPRICPMAHQAASSREQDCKVWYAAHQMYRRDPEELTDAQTHNVRRWCRCNDLCLQSVQAGLASLTNEECELVIGALRDFCPDLEEHQFYYSIYESCRRRLAAHD